VGIGNANLRQDGGQPGIHSETLPQKTTTQRSKPCVWQLLEQHPGSHSLISLEWSPMEPGDASTTLEGGWLGSQASLAHLEGDWQGSTQALSGAQPWVSGRGMEPPTLRPRQQCPVAGRKGGKQRELSTFSRPQDGHRQERQEFSRNTRPLSWSRARPSNSG
jgi:hypothetical protein